MTLHLTATKMAEYIMERANISKQRKAVFIYGCELTLSTIASVLSIIILSIFLNAIYSSFVFLLVFIGIRLFAGGYHAKTYSHCFLLTNFVYLLSFLLSEYVIITPANKNNPSFYFCSRNPCVGTYSPQKSSSF